MSLFDNCSYNHRVNLNSTCKYPKKMIDLGICEKCNQNPILDKYDRICILCHKNINLNNPCYNCDLCIKTREYLKETNEIFELDGYGKTYYQDIEYWKCKKCNHFLQIQILFPGMERELLHEIMRRDHLDKWCELLNNGSIIVDR